jgi:hypothetical protein
MKLRKNFIGQDGFQWWIGVVEDRDDPEKLGRCRVRIFGIHTDDTVAIPTEDLPWAIPIYSVNNNDVFSAPKEGEYVVGFFLDGSFSQSPAMLGVLPGINKQNPPDGRGFGDLRTPDRIRNSPKKPAAIDYPEARTGNENPVSGNIINDGLGLTQIVTNSITLHIKPSLTAKPSLTESEQSIIGYDHKFTQQEIKQGYVFLSALESVPIFGINGADTTITAPQSKLLLQIDIANSIERAKNSIGLGTWNTLNVAQQAGLTLHAYHIGLGIDFERIGVRSAITSGDFVRAAQLISADKLKSATGKYLRSEDSLSHVAANLFKSIPKSQLIQDRKNDLIKRNPISASGAGLGVQIHESDISADEDAKSLKYPIPEQLGKPSINDLATSLEKTLIQKFRERSTISAIGANDQSWSEPASPYASEYPHNKAMETESGHVLEFDDTPGSERVHLAHRSGSFVEFYPSGTKVEKVVKSNYRIVMNDDHLYVAGKVNIVLESNAHIKVVGDCFLQVENNLEANVSANMNVSVGGSFNMKANTMHFDIANTSTITANNQYISIDDKLVINSNTSNISTANDFTLFSSSNQYFNVANTIHYRSGNVAIQSSGNVSINAVGNGYFTSSNVLHLKGSSTRVTGSSVDVNGLLNAGATNMEATGYDSNGDSHVLSVAGAGALAALIPDPSLTRLPAIDANGIVYLYHEDENNQLRRRTNSSEEQIILLEIADQYQINVKQVQEIVNATSYLQDPIKKGTPTETQKHLEPDRIVRLRDSINEENDQLLRNYLANPYAYGSSYSNVKRYIGLPAKSGSDLIFNDVVGESLIVINDGADISSWLKRQLTLAANGYWKETGVEISGRVEPSNPNITDLWRNLGFSREFWNLSDQTPWAIAFVNYGLKQNGYRYVQTPNPKDLEIRFNDYRFTRVKPEDARSGDVVLWNNDHTNFVYENRNGSLTFIGGSQPPYDGNVGDGRIGDVSIVGSGGAQIVAILRPSKT